jgi:hypothetical protein
VGGYEAGLPGSVEPTVRYHPLHVRRLTYARHPGGGHYQAGSLTGAVASQNVTEALEGWLKVFGNHLESVKA